MAHYEVTETVLTSEDLPDCSEAFITNSLLGIMPVCQWAGQVFTQKEHAIAMLKRYYANLDM